jgi:hypothetical protein
MSQKTLPKALTCQGAKSTDPIAWLSYLDITVIGVMGGKLIVHGNRYKSVLFSMFRTANGTMVTERLYSSGGRSREQVQTAKKQMAEAVEKANRRRIDVDVLKLMSPHEAYDMVRRRSILTQDAGSAHEAAQGAFRDKLKANPHFMRDLLARTAA